MNKRMYGVNLGGWLVLEKWITPSLFAGYAAEDEWSLCHELDDRAHEVLDQHRKQYITEADFAWLAEHGVNAVRLPVGHGVFGAFPPFTRTIEYVDFAFQTAAKYGIAILLDLHTVPGSQNGWDHSGRAGDITWSKFKRYSNRTVNIVTRLAERYGKEPNLLGIEVLNEPHWTVDKGFLAQYYENVYAALRKIGYQGTIVFQDGFDPQYWGDFLSQKKWKNIQLDLHLYQCFSEEDKKLNLAGHLHKTQAVWGQLIRDLQEKFPVIVGEWSLGLDPESLGRLSPKGIIDAETQYGQAQMTVFNQTAGWYFWTYKTESPGGWNFRSNVEQGNIVLTQD